MAERRCVSYLWPQGCRLRPSAARVAMQEPSLEVPVLSQGGNNHGRLAYRLGEVVAGDVDAG